MAAEDTIRPVSPAFSSLCDLVDEVLFFYTEWREEATEVEEIYCRWCAATGAAREHCYGGYIAALDQEEAAAMMYAVTATELRGLLQAVA
jgi:hypothetical protein